MLSLVSGAIPNRYPRGDLDPEPDDRQRQRRPPHPPCRRGERAPACGGGRLARRGACRLGDAQRGPFREGWFGVSAQSGVDTHYTQPPGGIPPEIPAGWPPGNVRRIARTIVQLVMVSHIRVAGVGTPPPGGLKRGLQAGLPGAEYRPRPPGRWILAGPAVFVQSLAFPGELLILAGRVCRPESWCQRPFVKSIKPAPGRGRAGGSGRPRGRGRPGRRGPGRARARGGRRGRRRRGGRSRRAGSGSKVRGQPSASRAASAGSSGAASRLAGVAGDGRVGEPAGRVGEASGGRRPARPSSSNRARATPDGAGHRGAAGRRRRGSGRAGT